MRETKLVMLLVKSNIIYDNIDFFFIIIEFSIKTSRHPTSDPPPPAHDSNLGRDLRLGTKEDLAYWEVLTLTSAMQIKTTVDCAKHNGKSYYVTT